MARIHSFAPGEYYHIYSRGVDKRHIFLDENDRQRFIKLLFWGNGKAFLSSHNHRDLSLSECIKRAPTKREPDVFIGAYCLMPNHFHLLIKERDPAGVSRFMRKILTGYSMYFNIKHERTGQLFESSFKTQHVIDDIHLKHLFTYIHLNPKKILLPHGNFDEEILLEKLASYPYSSFNDYMGVKRDEGQLIHKSEFPTYYSTKKEFAESLAEWGVDNYRGLTSVDI